jgi:putative transposase
VGVEAPSYRGFRFPVEIISHGVWLYYRFPLSFREVEEMMLERGIVVSHETIRQWCAKFGQTYASALRRRRARPGVGGSGAGAMTTTGGRSRSLMFLRFPARRSHYGGHGR